jgi:hypothetical protein
MRVADGGEHREGPAVRAALGGGLGEVAATLREVGGFPGTDAAIQVTAGGESRGVPAKPRSPGGRLEEIAANRAAFRPDPPLLSAKPGSLM